MLCTTSLSFFPTKRSRGLRLPIERSGVYISGTERSGVSINLRLSVRTTKVWVIIDNHEDGSLSNPVSISSLDERSKKA